MSTNDTRTLETFATTDAETNEQTDDDCDCDGLDTELLPCFDCFEGGASQ